MNTIKRSTQIEAEENIDRIKKEDLLSNAIIKSWLKIAPFWPLKNLIAVNPLAGLEDKPFEEALRVARAYFQQKDLPKEMLEVNRASIKWLQAFFDEGQSTIQMPMRHKGLLKSVLTLLCFDKKILKNKKNSIWLLKLPQKPEALIAETLLYLGIQTQDQEQFLTLMLTTLPGWAAHIQYRTNWADARDAKHPYPVTQSEYLALRLVLTCLIWPSAKQLLSWQDKALEQSDVKKTFQKIGLSEKQYQKELLTQLRTIKPEQEPTRPKAQFVFCIDVRSEPFRRALEAQGAYETYGFAGFFGLPISIENAITRDTHASCPVLLKPVHHIVEKPVACDQSYTKKHNRLLNLKKLYQSLKYTFTTPFSLAETIGLASGFWMALKSFSPKAFGAVHTVFRKLMKLDYSLNPDIEPITQEQKVTYAATALKMMGLTKNFSPLIVLCGHGSTTQNNAYATALDCGACGGRHGAPNARILAAILNSKVVRTALKDQEIVIPLDTFFLGAEHNTTTDEVEIYTDMMAESYWEQIGSLKQDLETARKQNSFWRCQKMGVRTDIEQAQELTKQRSKDWAQVLPEWGLARNASFIIGPRWLTRNVNLDGRVFLHSYEWEKDPAYSSLTTILTAPMIVAQWINAQYLFSTLDNVAFGAGSKVTKNITGKIGIMQGNASDLMHGLPLQSVLRSDTEPYHQPMRLTVVVYAPRQVIDLIIKQQDILQKLFRNGWVHFICYEPSTTKKYSLQRDLTWEDAFY